MIYLNVGSGKSIPEREIVGIFDMDTATYDADGSMKFVYIADEIGGFAFHICH